MRRIVQTFLLLVLSFTVFAQEKLPKIQREFRAVWITTVANSDYPSKQDLTAEQQQAELIKWLDIAQELKMNAVIFQVRSMGDAMYESSSEPWSAFLMGEVGKKSGFDPLKFLIDEAHARGIVVHAWFNPYRATHSSIKSELPESHVSKKHPEWMRAYSTYKMLDPGISDVQSYITDVVNEVVSKYDIDGVHFDDYFYPYPANDVDFPDSETYEAYKKSGGKLSKEDWRRKNVNDFVQNISASIKKIKPTVMFGISPFGIWKPDEIEDIRGTSSYDQIFADSRKWLQEGWVDYLAPQLYWSTTNKTGQLFPVLLKWWNNQNKKKRHLWVGIAPYKVGDEKYPDYSSKEIETEIAMTRQLLKDDAGAIHFRASFLAANKDNLKDHLKANIYNTNALIPESPWIDATKPDSPQLDVSKDSSTSALTASWKNTGKKEVFRWVFYWKVESGWKVAVLPIGQVNASVPANLGVQKFAIAGVDRLGNISEPTIKDIN